MANEIKIAGKMVSATTEGILTDASQIQQKEGQTVEEAINKIDNKTIEIVNSVGNLNNDKLNKNSTSESVIKDDSDAFYFCDKRGNVLAKIDSNGIKAISFFDKDEKEIVSVTKEVIVNLIGGSPVTSDDVIDLIKTNIQNIGIFNSKDDGYYFTDKDYNIVAKITSNGLQAIKFLDMEGKEIKNNEDKVIYGSLKDKHIWAIGDSHSSGGYRKIWMNKLVEIGGAIYDHDKNDDINSNPTDTYPQYVNYMIAAAAKLRDLITNGEKVDIIFLENVHWSFDENQKDVFPFLGSVILEYPQTFISYQELKNTWSENVDIIESFTERKAPNALIKLNYKSIKRALCFTTNKQITSGNVTLRIGNSEFNTELTDGMTLKEALTKINAWAFADYTNNYWTNSTLTDITDDTINISYTGEDSSRVDDVISLEDTSNTGLVLESSEKEEVVNSQLYGFFCRDVSEWNIKSNWSATNGTEGYPYMKALYEFIQKEMPNVEVILWTPQSYYLEENTYLFQDGSFDYNTYKKSNDNYIRNNKAQQGMIEVAKEYNIKVIDVMNLCGITPLNAINGGFYNYKDVHPKEKGYIKWAETIYKEIN